MMRSCFLTAVAQKQWLKIFKVNVKFATTKFARLTLSVGLWISNKEKDKRMDENIQDMAEMTKAVLSSAHDPTELKEEEITDELRDAMKRLEEVNKKSVNQNQNLPMFDVDDEKVVETLRNKSVNYRKTKKVLQQLQRRYRVVTKNSHPIEENAEIVKEVAMINFKKEIAANMGVSPDDVGLVQDPHKAILHIRVCGQDVGHIEPCVEDI